MCREWKWGGREEKIKWEKWERKWENGSSKKIYIKTKGMREKVKREKVRWEIKDEKRRWRKKIKGRQGSQRKWWERNEKHKKKDSEEKNVRLHLFHV